LDSSEALLSLVDAEPLRGSPHVTVHASHFALCDLGLDRRPRESVRDQLRYVPPLIAEMIEFEHHRIRFSAVDAVMLAQVSPRANPIFGDSRLTPGTRALNQFAAIRDIPTVLVGSGT
jgi:hypothetical protein